MRTCDRWGGTDSRAHGSRGADAPNRCGGVPVRPVTAVPALPELSPGLSGQVRVVVVVAVNLQTSTEGLDKQQEGRCGSSYVRAGVTALQWRLPRLR